ncbi:hypothetical protein [Paenibacillus sp. 598K]|uniref:hypothetical protein n=1 Tax=Paenibacillus sp. 598K TaxID=1117987 RepID=UPI000FFE7AF6|nr:hypothetical protein [Paenibacillus sp. 598K]
MSQICCIRVNEDSIPVNLVGTDQKLIPFLLSVLNSQEALLSHWKDKIISIDLFSADAILYFKNGRRARMPIF